MFLGVPMGLPPLLPPPWGPPPTRGCQDLKAVARELGENMSDEELQEMIREADKASAAPRYAMGAGRAREDGNAMDMRKSWEIWRMKELDVANCARLCGS